MYSVGPLAKNEHKAVCDLVNQGLDRMEIFRAAYTFYRDEKERQLVKSGHVRVQEGLFQGLTLYSGTIGSSLLPKYNGTYEKELQNWLSLHCSKFDCFAEIGSAEGFYVCGIAKKFGISCVGFDINLEAKVALEYGAVENNICNLVAFTESIRETVESLVDEALVLIDVDGSEIEVLNELEAMTSEPHSFSGITLIVETDRDQRGQDNSSQISQWLSSKGWTITDLIRQDPRLRFSPMLAEESFLEQVVQGAEGRHGRQKWIIAFKSF